MVRDYKILLRKKERVNDKLKNLGRERDLKVDRINNFYQSKINSVIRDLELINIEIEGSKKFVGGND